MVKMRVIIVIIIKYEKFGSLNALVCQIWFQKFNFLVSKVAGWSFVISDFHFHWKNLFEKKREKKLIKRFFRTLFTGTFSGNLAFIPFEKVRYCFIRCFNFIK